MEGTDETKTGPASVLEAQMGLLCICYQLIHLSWNCIQSGDERPLPARLDLRLRGGLCDGAGCGTLLAGCLGVSVPRPVPVGAVAGGLLVDGHAFARWDHLVSSETVGTYSRQRSTAKISSSV